MVLQWFKKKKNPHTDYTTLSGLSFLVVDDNEFSLLVAKQQLEKRHASVVSAANPDDAISHAKENCFDVMFIDINLGDESGFDVLHKIRSDCKSQSKTSIAIAFSATNNYNFTKECYQAGFDIVMPKQIDFDLLNSVVPPLIDEEKFAEAFADEDLFDLAFDISRNKSGIQLIHQAYYEQEYAKVADLAHQMSGNFMILYCPRAAAFFSKIEKCSKKPDVNWLGVLLQQMNRLTSDTCTQAQSLYKHISTHRKRTLRYRKPIWRGISITTKLRLAFGGITLFASLCTYFGALFLVQSSMEIITKSETKNLVELARKRLKIFVLFADNEQLKTALRSFEQNDRIVVASIHSSNGKELFSFRRALTPKFREVQREINCPQLGYCHAKVPIIPEEEAQYLNLNENTFLYLVTYSPIIAEQLSAVAAFALKISFVTLVIGLMLAEFVQRKITRQLKSLQDVALEVSKRSDITYSTRVFVDSDDELGRVAKAFNTMLDAIGRRDEAKRQAIANTSHDLRSPLAAIIGRAEQIMDRGDKHGIGQSIHYNAEKLLGIVNDLLDVEKINSGHFELNPIPCLLVQEIQRCIESISTKARNLDIHLVDKLPEDDVTVVIDNLRLFQVLANLLSNAMKFTSSGGTVTIYHSYICTDENCRFQIAVSDTGIGIAPEKLNAIFEAYVQADISTTRNFGGTGLGLTITKKIVELMGGRIWAESKINQGSTFYIECSVPLFKGTIQVAIPSEQVPLEEISRLQVLLVDDQEDLRAVGGYQLEKLGLKYDLVSNGVEAISMVKNKRYDLIFMDHQMPGMDGFQTTDQIRKFEAIHRDYSTPIYALTANAMVGFANKCMVNGMNGHIPKPLDGGSLQDFLTLFLKNHNPDSI